MWNVPKMWEGGECWIIGGGHSIPFQFDVPIDIIKQVCEKKLSVDVYSDYMKAIHSKHIIGINNAYQIGAWIDILFFGDGSWYLPHKEKVAQWSGIKVSCAPRFNNNKDTMKAGIKFVPKNSNHRYGISPNKNTVSWNHNSGAAAISLAAHLGVQRIYLLGFDMCSINSITHWHGGHRSNNNNKGRIILPPFKRHLIGFSAIAKDAKRMKIEIINVSPDSKIEVFKKVSFKEINQ